MTREQILELLAAQPELLRKWRVKSLHLFGSVARNAATAASDIDVLVEFEPDAHIGLFEFSRLQRELSGLFHAPVDLVTPEALHPLIKETVLREAVRAA